MSSREDVQPLSPSVRNPFFIVSPTYARTSAGIATLHILCHHLNALGESAFIVEYPLNLSRFNYSSGSALGGRADNSTNLDAPTLTMEVIDFYHQRKITPIVIYPEIFDNPLRVAFFGRFILNYPGMSTTLGVYKEVEAFAFAYSKILADHCTDYFKGRPPIKDVLFVPTTNLDFWNRSGESSIRRGTCFYAGKMQRIHRKFPERVPSGSAEILSSYAMSPDQIRNLFWRTQAFYCCEDSALAIEAQLCGCPTVFMPNEFFNGTPLASVELGRCGSCLFGEPDGLKYASRTVSEMESIVRRHLEELPERVAEIKKGWTLLAAQSDYHGTIAHPVERRLTPVVNVNNDASTVATRGYPKSLVATEAENSSLRVLNAQGTFAGNEQMENSSAFISGHAPRTESSTAIPEVKRIAFFAHFDKDGMIDDHVIYYLNKLRGVSSRIIFASDCDLRTGEAQKLENIAEIVNASRHGEYDFGSWKRCFAAVDFDLSQWDELIIANDSCYAPLFSLETTFELITDCDFWGATKEWHSRISSDLASRRAGKIPQRRSSRASTPHILEDFDFLNSYFMVFRKAVIVDPAFIAFWYRIKRQEDKFHVIEMYEMTLTKLLVSLGYKFSCLATRAGTVFYKRFEVMVPKDFELPWLRVLTCRKNEEGIAQLGELLERINYPRFLIDRHIERMTGTASPLHYHVAADSGLWRAKYLALSLKERVAYKLKLAAAKHLDRTKNIKASAENARRGNTKDRPFS